MPLKTFKIMDAQFLKSIPWHMVGSHEAQAQRNHQQSLQDLDRRGGLSPCEAISIINDHKYTSDVEAEKKLMLMIVGVN